MITLNAKLTHFSLIGFDGNSNLWKNEKNFPFLTLARCPVSGCHYPRVFKHSLWHVSLLTPSFFPREQIRVAKITSSLMLGDHATVEYGDVEYVGRINFGFDQSILAVSILGIKGQELSASAFENSIKLYTNLLTTPAFLKRQQPLVNPAIDPRESPIKDKYSVYYPHHYC